MLNEIIQVLRVFKLMLRSLVLTMYSCPSMRIISKKKLIMMLRYKKKHKRCVILGSGSSVIDTIDYLSRSNVRYDAYTANFGIYLPVVPVLATLELAADTNFSENVRSSILSEGVKRIQEKGSLVIFKNLQHDRVDRKYVLKNYDLSRVYGVMDICLNQSFSSDVVRKFVTKKNSFFLVQYINSIYTLVHLAELAGYEEILISGVDGGGKHFYIDNSFGMDEALHRQLVDVLYPDEKTAIGHHAKSIRENLIDNPVSITSSSIKVM
jgi:hypothetical protein